MRKIHFTPFVVDMHRSYFANRNLVRCTPAATDPLLATRAVHPRQQHFAVSIDDLHPYILYEHDMNGALFQQLQRHIRLACYRRCRPQGLGNNFFGLFLGFARYRLAGSRNAWALLPTCRFFLFLGLFSPTVSALFRWRFFGTRHFGGGNLEDAGRLKKQSRAMMHLDHRKLDLFDHGTCRRRRIAIIPDKCRQQCATNKAPPNSNTLLRCADAPEVKTLPSAHIAVQLMRTGTPPASDDSSSCKARA